MTSDLDIGARANIKFCVNLGHIPTDTYKLLKNLQATRCCRSIVFKWHERFRNGRKNLDDEVRSGRPRSISTFVKQKIGDVLDVDRRVTVRGLADEVASVILHQDNAPAHRASSISLEIDLLDFDTLIHPSYSPDLAPWTIQDFS